MILSPYSAKPRQVRTTPHLPSVRENAQHTANRTGEPQALYYTPERRPLFVSWSHWTENTSRATGFELIDRIDPE